MTEIANTITPYSWFYPLYIHASETNDNILPSKLEILFLLDTGASISVLNLPTFHVISKQLNINVPTNIQNKRAKTLTVANQTEVPIKHYISMTCFTEVNHKTRSFNIDFAVANIKYNILGTPFFKKHIQNIDFQQNIMTYTEQHPKLSTKTTFSTFTEKDYPYISYIYTIKCKEPSHFKPRSGKTIHFPIKNYSNLHFELEDNTKFYPTNPYTYFLQKFKNIFHFLDMIVNEKSKDSCATIIQNCTSYPATLPQGIIGYIEIPITQTTPPHYRVNDVNSLIHSVIHAYHPDTTTPNKQNPYTEDSNQELESWPIEPLAPQLARANKKYKSTIDLMYAYAHTPLDEETIKLTGFSSGDKLYAFIRGFYGLKGLPNFFTKQMSTFFRSLIDKRSALVYIDDILLLANEKQEMFELIKELHTIASRENLKLAPEKSFYMLLKVKFLGHEIGNNTIKSIPSKIEAIKRIPSPKEKKDVMQFLGSVNFYSKFIEKLHINLKPLYTLLHDDV